MSRIGKKPIELPSGVSVEIAGQLIRVKGPKGELARTIHPELLLKQEGTQVLVGRPSEETATRRCMGSPAR